MKLQLHPAKLFNIFIFLFFVMFIFCYLLRMMNTKVENRQINMTTNALKRNMKTKGEDKQPNGDEQQIGGVSIRLHCSCN